jgi:hypothetical protein
MEYNENEMTGPADKNFGQSQYRLSQVKEWGIFIP